MWLLAILVQDENLSLQRQAIMELVIMYCIFVM